MATRFGVDVGGTFTDLIFYDDENGEVFVGKGATNAAAPDEGIAQIVSDTVPDEALRAAQFFLHGTTVGINALLERKGAVVGLLTTDGFRDVLEIRRGDREEFMDSLWTAAAPLVPRRLRLPVRERVAADGSIHTPFEREDVARALEAFRANGVESIAVMFLNAYANPEHELAAEAALRELGYDGEISLSHRISGEFREYERSSTTVVDAYVRPRVSGYLRRLEGTLNERGFRGDCLVTRSGGGAMRFSEAGERPFETIMSGPVAGAVGAGELCRALDISQGITADVGGTSFDTCLILDGRPQVRYEGKVVEMPLQSPWVDVRSIGSGGGSIAHVDSGGLLRVGPRSAGAKPGPVCYGRGGTEPTVTDAAAHLGMLAFGELAGGLALDVDASTAALERLGRELGLDAEKTAQGILTIANAAMAFAIRSVTIEQGQDPREASILAFGGAGPLFGTLLAEELGVGRVVVPKHAGNFSAWGLLGQDLTRSRALTSIRTLDAEGVAAANASLATMFAELAEDGSDALEPALDLRYVGQEYTLTVHPRADPDGAIAEDAQEIETTFRRDYERTFGHRLDVPVEIVSMRATARTSLPRKANESSAVGGTVRPRRSLEAYSFTQEERVTFGVVDRAGLDVSEFVEGPLIVLEETTTTYVDVGYRVHVHPSGTMIIEKKGAGS
ncbi:MAG: hyuA [Conexibacter sp.]|nr:hyuA [Conexibacter sp.]